MSNLQPAALAPSHCFLRQKGPVQRRPARTSSVYIRAAGQANRKHRSLTRFACHGHVAAHHAGELAGDGKAQPCSAIATPSQTTQSRPASRIASARYSSVAADL